MREAGKDAADVRDDTMVNYHRPWFWTASAASDASRLMATRSVSRDCYGGVKRRALKTVCSDFRRARRMEGRRG